MPKPVGPRARILECLTQNECRVNAPLLCNHNDGDLFTCEDNMCVSRVKICSFRGKAHLVFHWCLYNKMFSYVNNCSMDFPTFSSKNSLKDSFTVFPCFSCHDLLSSLFSVRASRNSGCKRRLTKSSSRIPWKRRKMRLMSRAVARKKI